MNFKPARLTDTITVGPWTGTLASLLADKDGIRLGVAKGGKQTQVEVLNESLGFVVADMDGGPKVTISVVVKRDAISPVEAKQVEHAATVQARAKREREEKDETARKERVSEIISAQQSVYAQSIGAKVEAAVAQNVATALGSLLMRPNVPALTSGE